MNELEEILQQLTVALVGFIFSLFFSIIAIDVVFWERITSIFLYFFFVRGIYLVCKLYLLNKRWKSELDE